MGQSNSLVPTEKDHIQKKRISEEIFKALSGKLGELETHSTYAIGSQVRYVPQLPDLSARHTAQALLLRGPQGGQDADQLATSPAART